MNGYFERLVSRLADAHAVQPVQSPSPAPVIDPFAEAEAIDDAPLTEAPAVRPPLPVEPPPTPLAVTPEPAQRDIPPAPGQTGTLEPPPAPPPITEIVTIERIPADHPAALEPAEPAPSPEPPAPVIETRERLVERVETRVAASPSAPLEPSSNPLPMPPAEPDERELAIGELQPPMPEPQAHAASPAAPVVMIEPPRADDMPEPVPPAAAPETKISIGEIVVEVVQKAAPPPARPRPARAPRLASPAPRPGVRSKRGYGLGQM